MTAIASAPQTLTRSTDGPSGAPAEPAAEVDLVKAEALLAARVFDAPRELVFDAYTDPKHIAEWWGPNGFTTSTVWP